jgi:hypothetical protein
MFLKLKYLATVVFIMTGISTVRGQDGNVPDQLVPVDESTGMVIYQEVVSENGTKSDFFNRAVNWINEAYKNPTSVTTVRDPESGKIEGNYRFKIYKNVEEGIDMEWGTILYSFKLEFKDGRYRYSFYDFLLKADSKYPLERWLDPADPDYNETCVEKLQKVDAYMKDLIEDLELKMKPKETKQEVEW